MQIKKKIKKGFTLVELVVVIAVIAILAAVSIGAYFGITDSANRSADEQAVTQMNTMLETHEILNGKVDDVEAAKHIFEDNGLTDYTPFYGKNTFYWTYDDSRVIIWEEDKGVTYPSWAVEKYKDNSTANKTSANWYDLEKETKTVDLENSFFETIEDLQENSVIVLEENSTLDIGNEGFVNIGNAFINNNNIDNITIDLNGSTLDAIRPFPSGVLDPLDVPINKTLIIENGTINAARQASHLATISLNVGSTLILRNVELNTNGAAIYTQYPASEVIIENSVINAGAYGIGTNASGTTNIYMNVVIRESTISALTTLFINVKGSVKIEKSDLYAKYHSILMRTGSIHASNSTFNVSEVENDSIYYYDTFKTNYGCFSGGNALPSAVAVLGNYTNYDYTKYTQERIDNEDIPYAGDVEAIFEDCKLKAASPDTVPQFILSADNHTSVILKYKNCDVDNSNIIQYEPDETGSLEFGKRLTNNTGTIQINGTLYNYAGNKYSA